MKNSDYNVDFMLKTAYLNIRPTHSFGDRIPSGDPGPTTVPPVIEMLEPPLVWQHQNSYTVIYTLRRQTIRESPIKSKNRLF